MTPEEAIEYGVKLVERLTHADYPGTAAERVTAALEVAAFVVDPCGYGDDTDPDDPEPTDPAGTAAVPDQETISTTDVGLTALKGVDPRGRPVVGIIARRQGVVVHIPLSPAAARRHAADTLNAADECDGTTPLTFLPGDPPDALPNAA